MPAWELTWRCSDGQTSDPVFWKVGRGALGTRVERATIRALAASRRRSHVVPVGARPCPGRQAAPTASRLPVGLRFRDATLKDVAAIAGLQNAAAGAPTTRFGAGPWSSLVTERNAELSLRHARIRLGMSGRHVVTVLRLATKKPRAIDVAYFTSVRRPLYLTRMAVSVAHHGQGFGRLALAGARATAVAWPADAIRLDACDAEAGAGRFYARCGFAERGHVVYKGDPLTYHELVLAQVDSRRAPRRVVQLTKAGRPRTAS